MPDQYLHRLADLIERAGATNDAALDEVAGRFADTLAGGGLVHLYGSGHSVLPCQEAFPRYGSYVGFNPLTDPRVMWHNVLGAGGVRELLWLERTEGYVDKFLAHQPLNEGDCLVVYSHSGRNAAGIEVAQYAKVRGLFVVAVSSGRQPGPTVVALVRPAARRRRRRRWSTRARRSRTPSSPSRGGAARWPARRRCWRWCSPTS